MKLTTVFGAVALLDASAVLADLHNFCACGHRNKGTPEQDSYWDFYEDVTKFACARYRARDTGTKAWDKCSDCQMDTQDFDGHIKIPACFSFGSHMGGDEFDYYCGLKGRQGYCKSIS